MQVLLTALGVAVLYTVAYLTYGRWIGRRIFMLAAGNVCPSVSKNDGTDFVPTPRAVLFGHHFASIAGTGPIVGPAIAVLWGWIPALVWILLGSIFMGAVHDLGSLVVSVRKEGRTIGDIAGDLISPRARLLFLSIIFIALCVFLAVLGLVMSSVFRLFPSAIFPCLVQIPLAVMIGVWLHRTGKGIFIASSLTLMLMYLSVCYGDVGILHSFNVTLSQWPVWAWVVALLFYSYVASVLPVWMLLQPRDFINALQLISICLLLIVGLAVASIWGGSGGEPLTMLAPAFNLHPGKAPPFLPFLFITVACGAVSGFHNIVSSGTTSKQLANERDALPVGFGGMLSEGFLATLVILACGAGIGLGLKTPDGTLLKGIDAWNATYSSWGAMSGLGSSVGAFVHGSGNFLSSLGIPELFATALMGLFVACFAGTSMDTACRLQRYVVEEISRSVFPRSEGKRPGICARILESRHGATLFAVLTAGLLAAHPAPGKAWTLESMGSGGLILWPLFGVTNQLSVGLAFIVITSYLVSLGKPVWMTVIPCLFMLAMPLWGIIEQVFIGWDGSPAWITGGNHALSFIGIVVILLEAGIIVEALALLRRSLKHRSA
ncbi:MAG TPA: carbon starvation protein A [Opitutales bacterium]|nr:carbon starvation protein A [Opitutales bacterium]